MAGLHIYNSEGGLVIGPDSSMGNLIGSFSIPRISQPWGNKLKGCHQDAKILGGTPFHITIVNGDVIPLLPDFSVSGDTIYWQYTESNAYWAINTYMDMDNPTNDIGDITVYYGVV